MLSSALFFFLKFPMLFESTSENDREVLYILLLFTQQVCLFFADCFFFNPYFKYRGLTNCKIFVLLLSFISVAAQIPSKRLPFFFSPGVSQTVGRYLHLHLAILFENPAAFNSLFVIFHPCPLHPSCGGRGLHKGKPSSLIQVRCRQLG